jgi:ferredoxin
VRLFIVLTMTIASVAFVGMTFSADGGKPVLAWEAVDGGWDHLELRGSAAPFETDSPAKGALMARILPDSVSGAFPTCTELAGSFVVEPEVCIGCAICVQACPVGAITLTDGKALIDPAACIACGLCASACPVSAIFAPTASAHYALFGIDAEGVPTLLESL